MIPIVEVSHIHGYDDYVSNTKTAGRDTYDDYHQSDEEIYKTSRELLATAHEKNWNILSYWEQSYKCDKCEYAMSIMTGPEDDTDTIVCPKTNCKYLKSKEK